MTKTLNKVKRRIDPKIRIIQATVPDELVDCLKNEAWRYEIPHITTMAENILMRRVYSNEDFKVRCDVNRIDGLLNNPSGKKHRLELRLPKTLVKRLDLNVRNLRLLSEDKAGYSRTDYILDIMTQRLKDYRDSQVKEEDDVKPEEKECFNCDCQRKLPFVEPCLSCLEKDGLIGWKSKEAKEEVKPENSWVVWYIFTALVFFAVGMVLGHYAWI